MSGTGLDARIDRVLGTCSARRGGLWRPRSFSLFARAVAASLSLARGRFRETRTAQSRALGYFCAFVVARAVFFN